MNKKPGNVQHSSWIEVLIPNYTARLVLFALVAGFGSGFGIATFFSNDAATTARAAENADLQVDLPALGDSVSH